MRPFPGGKPGPTGSSWLKPQGTAQQRGSRFPSHLGELGRAGLEVMITQPSLGSVQVSLGVFANATQAAVRAIEPLLCFQAHQASTVCTFHPKEVSKQLALGLTLPLQRLINRVTDSTPRPVVEGVTQGGG